MFEKLKQLVKKQNTDAIIEGDMEPAGDGFTSAENPKPKSEAFKSKPIIITVVIIAMGIAGSIFLSHKVVNDDKKSEEKEPQTVTTGIVENDSTKALPGTYSELAKFKAKQAQQNEQSKKTEPKEEPLIKPREKVIKAYPLLRPYRSSHR